MMHVHFIGLGGTGLSAIALVLLERGFTVSGSDRQASPVLTRLQQTGAKIMLSHQPENIQGADVVVRSSAIKDDNSEVTAALDAGIPVLKRSDFLGQLLKDNRTIAVAGSHGKTTTTAMISWMLARVGKDPSFIIGSNSVDLGTNAHAGLGEHFVIEADEYDGMFLGLSPMIAIVTNIEHDHPDCYPTAKDFYQAFELFSRKLKPGGILLACADDQGALKLSREYVNQGGNCLLYGKDNKQSDFRAGNLQLNSSGGYNFSVFGSDGDELTQVSLKVPGLHNVLNSLAAISVAAIEKLPIDQSAMALSEFRGTSRRFEVRGEPGGITIVDDYAHHPSEITATLAAARARFGSRRIWVVWQPHTFSRTRLLQEEFSRSFGNADNVIVTEIYPAREPLPDDGFSSRVLVEKIRLLPSMAGKQIGYVSSLEEAIFQLQKELQKSDVLLVLSAGDANRISDTLVSAPIFKDN